MIKSFNELFQSSPSNNILRLKLGEINGMDYKNTAHRLQTDRALDLSYEDEDEYEKVLDKEHEEETKNDDKIKDLVNAKGKKYPKKASYKKSDQAYPQFNYIVNFTDYSSNVNV